jgi:hypothetical protein
MSKLLSLFHGPSDTPSRNPRGPRDSENRWCLRNISLVQLVEIADLTNEAACRRIRTFGTQFTM